ncbi:MAG: PAS domain S-box protein [Candidatus Aminicenantes bacterium]|nr:PAS domain S-box protein [Candidatus Aminicenantes bacterium]
MTKEKSIATIDQKGIRKDLDRAFEGHLFEHAPEAIALSDTDGILLRVNNEFLNLFGYTKEEVLGRHVDDVVAPEKQHADATAVTLKVARGQKLAVETIRYNKTGKPIYVFLLASPIIVDNRQIGVFGVYRDISNIKKSEMLLQVEKAKVDQLFESAQEAIVMTDNSGKIIRANPEFLRLFGYTKEEVTGSHVDDIVAPQKQHSDASSVTKAVSQGKKCSIETIRYHKNGKPIHVSLLAAPITVNSSQLAVYAIYRDITERKLNERQQKKTLRELEQANKDLREFAYFVSHDLKSSLRGINQLANWLFEDYGELYDTNGKKQLEMMMSRVTRMHNLLNGILQYSRAGRRIGEDEDVDMNELVDDTLLYLQIPSHIHVKIVNPLPTLRINRNRIEQIFQNLIGNAVKFLDKSEGTIEIDCKEKKDSWEFSITDNGPGIDPKFHEKIFKVFQTLEARDVQENLGIGLAVVKKILENMGGTIRVESQPKEGSSFIFTIPKTQD